VRAAMIAGLAMLVIGAGCLVSAARTVARQR
jgi:HAMP domain-containing protein